MAKKRTRKQVFIATRIGEHIGEFPTREAAQAAIDADKERTDRLARQGWCNYPTGFWWDIQVR